MPRRRTYAQSLRTCHISMRVTPEVHARLAAEAAQIGMSVSGLAERYVAQGAIRIEASAAPPPMPVALAAELKRIGNNLNQIAHALNSNLPADVTKATRTLRDLMRLMVEDDLLSRRLNAVRHLVNAHGSPPSRPRQEFQGVVQVRPARPEGDDA